MVPNWPQIHHKHSVWVKCTLLLCGPESTTTWQRCVDIMRPFHNQCKKEVWKVTNTVQRGNSVSSLFSSSLYASKQNDQQELTASPSQTCHATNSPHRVQRTQQKCTYLYVWCRSWEGWLPATALFAFTIDFHQECFILQLWHIFYHPTDDIQGLLYVAWVNNVDSLINLAVGWTEEKKTLESSG
jgi:hypothetical protein